MNKRRIFVGVVGLAAGASLIGLGAGAAFTDSGTATQHVSVGTFGIAVASSTSGAVVVNNGTAGNATHTVAYTAADIQSSAAGNSPLAFTVTSTGSMPATVNVSASVVTGDSKFTDMLGSQSAQVLGNGQTHTYAAGLKWSVLDNTDLSKTSSILYTITATEGAVATGLPDGTVQVVNGVVDVVNVSTWKIDPSAGQGSSLAVANGDMLYLISDSGINLVATAANGKISYHGTVTGSTHYLSLHQLVTAAPGSDNYWYPYT